MIKLSLKLCSFTLMLGLVACNNVPVQAPPTQPVKPKPAALPQPSSGVKITPYQQAVIGRKNLLSMQNGTANEQDSAVFGQLMQSTVAAYNARRWADAERFALQAQRISPRAAETYLYLGLVAKQEGQLRNSSNLARQGLSYAQSDALHKQLWLLILQNAQQQKDQAIVKQAQLALRSL